MSPEQQYQYLKDDYVFQSETYIHAIKILKFEDFDDAVLLSNMANLRRKVVMSSVLLDNFIFDNRGGLVTFKMPMPGPGPL